MKLTTLRTLVAPTSYCEPPLVSQCYAMRNELLHVHVDVNQQSSNSLTNCSTNSCDSGTVLLNYYTCALQIHDKSWWMFMFPCYPAHVCVWSHQFVYVHNVCQQKTTCLLFAAWIIISYWMYFLAEFKAAFTRRHFHAKTEKFVFRSFTRIWWKRICKTKTSESGDLSGDFEKRAMKMLV